MFCKYEIVHLKIKEQARQKMSCLFWISGILKEINSFLQSHRYDAFGRFHPYHS